jgi:hypothetical protein
MNREDIDIIADVCSARTCDRLEPRLAKLDEIPARVAALEKVNADLAEEAKEKRAHAWEGKVALVTALIFPLVLYVIGKAF